MESDAISRSRVLEALEAEKARLMEQKDAGWPFTTDVLVRAVDTVHEFIKGLPALDVAPVVHEQWIDACRGKVCICSRCGQEFDHTYDAIKDEWLFCPKCGAKMDAEEKPDAD